MCNWISFVGEYQLKFKDIEQSAQDKMLKELIQYVYDKNSLSKHEKELLEQSREAYIAMECCDQTDKHDEFHTDSENDDPEDWVTLSKGEPSNDVLKKKISQRKAILSRWKKRRISKIMLSRCMLKRKVPGRVSKTIKKYPNIGKDIERFARVRRIGADSWRRTGLLTFSGNVRKGPKLTYNRLRTHLEDKYQTKFSYGTVVQLCCARNNRHSSAK